MKCCVLSCKNYSDRRSDAMDGITFHVFPSDDNLKQQWMTKINRRDWTPTKYTKICSCHFNEEDFVMTKKGLRKLKKGTLPSLKLDISVNRRLLEPTIPSLEPTTSDLNEFLILHDTPKKKKLKQEIEQLRWKAKKDGLKIRRLQMKLKRLKKKGLTDLGYEHIPPGPDRQTHIVRAQRARRLGAKTPPPFPNGWFVIAESQDLKIGEVLPVDALGQNLCLYRGDDNIPRCVDAYCPHLGANLAVGGAVIGNCIECPFHKWKFGEDGACVSVPGVEKGPGHVRLLLSTSFGPLLVSQSVTPLGPLVQRVVHRVYSPWYNAPFAAMMVKIEAYMFERDVAIWNRKVFVSAPSYVRTDKTIRAFRSWFAQFYSENSKSFRDAIQNPLDW
ncbi:unnamed protein product [Diatraea saccharalis]|uniref:cholesterol 7-desaturase n=1 Tax=Diatraea saccharalis TaxID=40085 RepID=A0A9N9R765_9NEOP|nr:unnamed protein product [Diatraea saccharalis]